MNPSLRAIEHAIDRLKASPGIFQRLVEGYARVAFPGLFNRLIPGGRRSDDVTRKGWPDATGNLPDGTSALLEATHSEEWERHLAEDVRKTEELSPGAAGAFLFAAWARTPEPEALAPYRSRLEALGIPSDRILFVFRDELVNELSRPLFARLWVDPLELPASCLPFDVVDRVPRLFGPEDRVDLFAPRRSEFLAGLVYRPRLARTVEERLAQSGWALVRGRGAAGKTTMALSIALGPAYLHHPVYYLDLAGWEEDESEQGAAIDTMATRGDTGVLFVVDNVHLAPEPARRLFEAWQELAGNRSRLLLLGRVVTPEPDVRGRAHPLEDLDREAFELTIDGDMLVGVYRRILSRFAVAQRTADPPPPTVESWLSTFGGDLIAFSTAVAQRASGLLRCEWELMPSDAQRYIQKEYLQALSQAERNGIARLAAVAALELALPAEALDCEISDNLLEQGWIIRTQHGAARHIRLELIHSGLGDLVHAALHTVNRLYILCEIAAANSFAGIMIARRFRLQNAHSETLAVLSAIAASPQWLSYSFSPSRLPATTKLFEEYGVLAAEEIDRRLCQEEYQAPVIETALRTQLGHLGSFLSYAKGKLPDVYCLLVQALSSAGNQDVLAATALRTPLHFLASFLGFVKNQLPVVHTMLTQALSSAENQEALTAIAMRTPLGDLGSFLSFAKGERELSSVYAELTQSLSSAENQEALTATAMRTPLGGLVSFLSFAEGEPELSAVYSKLAQALSLVENQEAMVETALRNSLEHLCSFLSFTQDSLPDVYRRVIQKLSVEDNEGDPALKGSANKPQILARRVTQAPLKEQRAFLKHEELARAIVKGINDESWQEWHLRHPGTGVEALPTIGRQLARLGRPELASAPAGGAILAALVPEWHRPGVQVTTLSHTIRLAWPTEPAALDVFLERIATPDWLKSRYLWADPGPLAGALFTLWYLLDSKRLRRFRTPVLLEIIENKMNARRVLDTPLSDFISLLGVGALIGLKKPRTWLTWANESALREAIAERLPAEEETVLGPLQVHLWLGLRELTTFHTSPLRIGKSEGTRILQLWREAAPENEKLKRLNRWMIAWLERCAVAGWRLVHDSTPFETQLP